jgi:phospholipid/cholesterol/gamma-HCH transport system substrate-binding protein
MSRRKRIAGVTAGLAGMVSVAAGCQWEGLNSLPLPGTQGTESGSYTVYVQMPDVTTLTPNSPVMVDDVTIGSVRSIDVQDWHALLTLSLNPGVQLPANAVAFIGQTSLLGSTHVSLAAPIDQTPEGRLAPGETIPLDRAGAYPTTEQTLSALSVVLNGGGFSSIGDIVTELNTALHGRADSVRDLLAKLNGFVGQLDAQRDDIETALTGLDDLGGVFARQQQTISATLQQLPPALHVLVDQRQSIVDALVALGKLSDTADQVIATSGANLTDELQQLVPLLTQVADTGRHITGVASILAAFPFPLHTYKRVVRGDYLNLMITYEVTPQRMAENFLAGTAVGPHMQPPTDPQPTTVPLTDPLRGPLQLPKGGGR